MTINGRVHGMPFHHLPFKLIGRRPILLPGRIVLLIVCLAAGCGTHSALATPSGTLAGHENPAMLLQHMSLKQKVGQMLMVSVNGTTLSPGAVTMLKQIQPGGITLFGDNFSSTGQLKGFDSALQHHSHIPLIISVDQEGGEVIRITKGVKQLPSEQAYGMSDVPATVQSDAATEAVQLHQLGINMNLAPVLDVARANSIIGSEQRSYGQNATVDTKLGLAAIKGYQSHGLAATAKHVVGLGTTQVNPETQLPHLSLTSRQLATQLSPFKAASRAGVDGMMVTHVVIAGVTSPTTPASLSYNVVTKILRNKFGYKGVLMTDSLGMGAISSHFGLKLACTMAVQAGEDVLLITSGGPNIFNQAITAVIAKVNAGKISMTRINASVLRILQLKQKLHLSLP